jgi:arabinose-5-phosphate isomerase
MSMSSASEADLSFLVDAMRAEAAAVERIASRLQRERPAGLAQAIELMERSDGHIVVSGVGKSGLIGAKISATLSSLGVPSHVIHPADALHGDLGRIRRGDVALLLSYSGETEEVVTLAAILKADGVTRIGLSKTDESSLARLCDAHVAMGDVEEACPHNLAPTASTTAMLALGDAMALELARRRDFKADDFHKHHPGGMLGVGLRPVTEAIRFRVGASLAVVRDTVTVREACEQASRTGGRRAGAVILVDAEGRLSGIFTDGDLRRLVLAEPAGLERPVSTVMTVKPQHLVVDDLVRDAVRLVRERRVDEIPVVDRAGRPVGLIDVQDLIAMKVVSE